MMRTATTGTVVTMRLTVAPQDHAAFDDEVVHELYGTASIVRHAEQVSRWILKRHLEEGEEGIGATVSVEHHEPVPVGAQVELAATVVEATASRLVTEIVVLHEGAKAATASVTQVVVDADRFADA